MKKKTLITLIILLVFGSFVNFFCTNLLMSDLSNMFYGVHDAYIIASIPGFMFAIDLALAVIYVLRLYKNPEYKKALTKLYTTFLIINSVIGVGTGIATAVFIYKDLFARYVFPLYTLLSIIIHTLLLAFALAVKVVLIKKMEDGGKKKVTFFYALYSAAASVLLYVAMYRFGAFLWLPSYLLLRTLHLSFTFYLWILLPMAVVVFAILHFLKIFKNRKQEALYIGIVGLANLVLGGSVFIIGSINPVLISSISPCLPIERLAGAPLGMIICTVLMILVTVPLFILTTRKEKQ